MPQNEESSNGGGEKGECQKMSRCEQVARGRRRREQRAEILEVSEFAGRANRQLIAMVKIMGEGKMKRKANDGYDFGRG